MTYSWVLHRTLYKQGPYGGKPVIRRALIITPGSLVKVGSFRMCNIYQVLFTKPITKYARISP